MTEGDLQGCQSRRFDPVTWAKICSGELRREKKTNPETWRLGHVGTFVTEDLEYFLRGFILLMGCEDLLAVKTWEVLFEFHSHKNDLGLEQLVQLCGGERRVGCKDVRSTRKNTGGYQPSAHVASLAA